MAMIASVLESSRGNTAIEIFCGPLDAAGEKGSEEDASVHFVLRVSACLHGPDGLLLDENSHVSGFVSTLRAFLAPPDDAKVVPRAIFAGLAGQCESTQLAALSLWITDISSAVRSAAAKAQDNRTGFELSVDIRVFDRPELLRAANAIDGDLFLSADGVLRLAGGDGIETVTISAGEEQEEEECAICFEALAAEGTEAKRMMGCNHIFHGGCLYRWFEANPNCPLCRRTAVAPGFAALLQTEQQDRLDWNQSSEPVDVINVD